MNDMQYLYDEQYYVDLYDLSTIKRCLRIIQFWQKAYREKSDDKEIKDLSKEEKLKGFSYYLNQELYGTQGERYRNKKSQIEEIVENDRKKQDFYDNTSAPSNISCNSCGKRLNSDTKILEDFMDKQMRVLFYFPCTTCKVKRAVYNTGEEFISKPSLCPKCGHALNEKHTIKKEKSKVIIWMRTCPSCKFKDKEIDDFEKSHLEWEKEKQKDKELLDKYRGEFCFTDEKGQEYIELIDKMRVAKEVHEEERQKYSNSVYQKSIKLKKVEIVELEKLLTELFEKERYIKLTLDKPEIGQFVIVPFTVQDADSSRKDYESSNNLQKILKEVLEDTNWRLLSNSLSYRLGYVSGQLKGYEREEDILEILGKKKEQKVKEISELRKKYEYDPMVSLARMIGQHEGIEDMRKKRLEDEPEGFFLEASEGSYNCHVCHELTQGNKAWWDLNGIKCVDCQRNINEGVIPAEICKDDKLWFKDWQIRAEYSIHATTKRKLIKEGLLHGRDLKRQDGTTYFTVYLVKENEGFLQKYPKKPQIKMTYIDPKGREMQM